MQSVFNWIQSELLALRRVVWIGLLDRLSLRFIIIFSLFVFLNSFQIIGVKEILSLFFIQVRRDQIAIPVESSYFHIVSVEHCIFLIKSFVML
jgi:hypothetical protein